jgi:transcription termination factor Rho
MYTLDDLSVRLLSELKEIAEEMGVKNAKKAPKKDLIYMILDQQATLPDSEIKKIKAIKGGVEAAEEADESPQREKKPKK